MARSVAIVPHTHWDREWYSPFQTFRLRLVDLLDEFLPRLEADPSYARFLLDGQMAVVDDYLEVRPEAEPVIRRLAASGRLAMGPWYILMDEFLVSGETIVRNLQRGLERAAAFGGAMPVGYLPDMFGHVAQMPQILSQTGIDRAVVWRGVPSAIDKTGFWWVAPDGSRVRAEYLTGGYGNGAGVPDDAKELVKRVAAFEDELGDLLPTGAPILFMNGTDHEVPQAWLGRVVAEANDLQDDYHLAITSLAEYLDGAPVDGLPEWRGELRSGANANLLMGVGSNRVDVKQAAARAERALERLAEPACALFLPPERWPAALLDIAWREVIRNSAHDSICACSHDEAVAAVVHRYAEARQIGEGLATRAVEAVAASMRGAGTVVVNLSARRRGGLIELTLPGGGPVGDGAQLLQERGSPLGHVTVRGDGLPGILGPIRSQQLDGSTYVNSVEVREDDEGVHVTLHGDSRLREVLNVTEIKADLLARVAGRPDVAVHLRVVHPPSRRVLTRVDDVDGFGWTTWSAVPTSASPVTAAGERMDNGLVGVTVDPETGTFAIDGVAGLGRLVDDGDAGDTYNYSPPDHDVVVDRPDFVDVTVLESGSMRARLRIRAAYTWPERLAKRGRTGAEPTGVTTTLELQAGEPFVRVRTTIDNRSRDHRVRAWFPLPEPATVSRAECAFAIVERGLEAEGGPSEHGLPTFPSRRFVSAGGLTIAHEGLLEYELVEGGSALAITLLRATGLLSRVEMTYRPLPAGPPLPLEGPQMQGPLTVSYAVQVGDCDPYALAEDVFVPLQTALASGGGDRPASGQALHVDGAEVSAVRRVAGGLEVRVFNPGAEPTAVSVGARRGWLVDLRGRPVEPVDGAFPLAPGRIATVHLADT
ncbi:MAG: 2-O-(6-phospho-alpha-D-mannosyl)-D-glycerate hydrolase [Actinomycetota bacterium]|jgi:alpha-mannosidase